MRQHRRGAGGAGAPRLLCRRAETGAGHRQLELGGVLDVADARTLVDRLEVQRIALERENAELRRARAEAEAGQERYTALFDFAPIGYAILDREGTILDVNHAGAHLLAQQRSRLLGRRFRSLLRTGQGSGFDAVVARARESEARESATTEVVHPDGRTLSLRLGVATLAHERAPILLAFEDVTECVEREVALAAAERALREANRRKDEFLGVLSHELRNPLTPIRTSLHVLGRAEPGSHLARRAQAVAERQAAQLTRLVDDLLDIARITHGKIRLQRAPVELRELVRGALDDHRLGFEESGIALEVRLDPGPFWVDADAARLTQILGNLLGNAGKFTPRAGGVVVALRREGPRAVLRVRDTGAGIPADLLPCVFEPFVQARRSPDRTSGGLGLGLAMVKGLVERHGGAVSVASAGPGRGTELTVALPLGSPPAPPACPPEAAPGGCRRVLIIEDHQDTADSLTDALALHGHEVAAAYDGRSGIARARQFRPDIVSCDLGLPEMDGFAVARSIRADADLRYVYLVALTGYGMPDDFERVLAAGFDEHVIKPATLERLRQLVGQAPGRKLVL